MNHLTPMKCNSYILQYACPRPLSRSATKTYEILTHYIHLNTHIYHVDRKRSFFEEVTLGKFLLAGQGTYETEDSIITKIEESEIPPLEKLE